MIAYNKIWLTNLSIRQEFKTHLKQNHITVEEFKAISNACPVGFYTPGFFARIGLAILTFVIVFFADGLLSLLFWASGAVQASGWIIFLGLLSYGGLELMVNAKNHFRSGVDDALLFLAAIQIATGCGILFYGVQENYTALSLIIFLMTLYLTIRFLDTLMAAICVASLLAFVFFIVEKTGSMGLTAMPFVMMTASALTYLLVMRLKNHERFVLYHSCLAAAEIICLLAFYAAGNYFAVQTLSNEITESVKPVAFGAFFWIWTFAIPLLYLGLGIKRKDIILIRISLFLIAIAALTFREYYHILPVDMMLAICGSAILIGVYALTKYLKTPKHGFTLEADDDTLTDNLKIESLVVAQTFAHTHTPQNDGPAFGGGDGGGGGSSGTF